MNEKDDFFAHPLSIVEGEIGKGTRIWAWVHIMKGAKIGHREQGDYQKWDFNMEWDYC
jgi:hypothetical protein